MPFVPPMQKVDEVLPKASTDTSMPECKPAAESDNYRNAIRVKTSFNKDIIEQQVITPEQESLFAGITKRIVFLQDEGVKNALYKMGYISPERLLPLKDAYLAVKGNEGGIQRLLGELSRLFDEPIPAAESKVETRDKPVGPPNQKIPPTVTKLSGSFAEGDYVLPPKKGE
tara:strand:+ start:2528 stop:3040 length:513 start_codon:yes stop_codon:yes gene_type:complete